MQIGYARVSTADQSMDLQRNALRAAGIKKIYEDIGSGAKAAADRGRKGGRPRLRSGYSAHNEASGGRCIPYSRTHS